MIHKKRENKPQTIKGVINLLVSFLNAIMSFMYFNKGYKPAAIAAGLAGLCFLLISYYYLFKHPRQSP